MKRGVDIYLVASNPRKKPNKTTSGDRRATLLCKSELPFRQCHSSTLGGGLSGEIQRIHVKHHRDVLRQWSPRQDGLDMLAERPRPVRAESDLEAELTV
jgi:hypothetical protein